MPRYGIGRCAHSVARKKGGRGDDDLEVGINVLPFVKHNKLKIKENNIDDGHKGTKHVVGLYTVLNNHMNRVLIDGVVVSMGAGVGSLVDRAEVVDRSVRLLRNNFQIRLRR